MKRSGLELMSYVAPESATQTPLNEILHHPPKKRGGSTSKAFRLVVAEELHKRGFRVIDEIIALYSKVQGEGNDKLQFRILETLLEYMAPKLSAGSLQLDVKNNAYEEALRAMIAVQNQSVIDITPDVPRETSEDE